MDTAGGQVASLIDAKQDVNLYGWTNDGKKLVFWNGRPIRYWTFDLVSRAIAELISHPKHDIHGAEISPDNRWLAFHLIGPVVGPLFIAPLRDGKAAEESEWIKIAAYPGNNRRPWWSADGNLLYFLSSKDQNECIWVQRLHPQTKRPAGEPSPLVHFHTARRTPGVGQGFGPAISRDAIILGLNERKSNVWIAEERSQAGR
jgi:Tol biopolymer transport system component